MKVELPNSIIDCEINDFIEVIEVDGSAFKAANEGFPAAFAKILSHNFIDASINGIRVVKGSLKTRETILLEPTKSMVCFMLNQIFMPGDLFYLYVAYPGSMIAPEGYSDSVVKFLNAPQDKKGEYLSSILNSLRKDKNYKESLQAYLKDLRQYLSVFFMNALGMVGKKRAHYLSTQVNGALDRYEANMDKFSIYEYLLKNNYHAPRRQYVVRNSFKVVSNMILSTRECVPLFVQDSKMLPDPDYVRFNKKATTANLYELVNLGPTIMYYRPLY
jgi:hypothetical protein